MVSMELGNTGEKVKVRSQSIRSRRWLALASQVLVLAGIVVPNAAPAQAPSGWVQVGWVQTGWTYPAQQPVTYVPVQPLVPVTVVQAPAPTSAQVWEPPQWRNVNGILVWDGYWRMKSVDLVNNANQPARDPDAMGKIKRYPKYKDFGNGIRGELIDEEGNEERVTRHTGTNRARYRLTKYVPGHRDEYGDWIPGHREELGEEEVGQDLDEERGERRDWAYRKR